jgi:hypothetical protein
MHTHTIAPGTANLVAVCALFLAACGDASPASPGAAALVVPAAPIRMDYVKVETAAGSLNWLGHVSGDVNGGLETRVVAASQSGHILHIRTQWSVDAGAQSFEASLDGTLDTATGALLLNGEVTRGYLAGARAHTEGRLTGTDTGTGGTVFEGFLRIMPASAR